MHPSDISLQLMPYTMIEIVRKYCGILDLNTQKAYLFYLMDKDVQETSTLLNTTEETIRCLLSNFAKKSYDFAVDIFKKGIDIKDVHYYTECMRDSEMDECEIASTFNEELIVTKITRHFMRRADLLSQIVFCTLYADAMEWITFIDIIHL